MSKPSSTESDAATPAILEDNLLPFSFPAVERKKVTAAFDGGRITSDGSATQRGAWISGLYATTPVPFWGQMMRT